MSFLESAKQYTGSDLETIFFRPILSGDSARELGVRVLYNMPVPTTIQLWDGQRNVLQKYSAAGWTGGNAATKLQKTISLGRVKAELGFSAADYFSLVYEKIAARADVNMDDLTGTELEQHSSNRPSPKASAPRCGWATPRRHRVTTPSTGSSRP